jgi:hypothetical protein
MHLRSVTVRVTLPLVDATCCGVGGYCANGLQFDEMLSADLKADALTLLTEAMRSEVHVSDEHVLTPSRRQHAEYVAACIVCNYGVLLEGPAAVGKTALVAALSASSGRPEQASSAAGRSDAISSRKVGERGSCTVCCSVPVTFFSGDISQYATALRPHPPPAPTPLGAARARQQLGLHKLAGLFGHVRACWQGLPVPARGIGSRHAQRGLFPRRRVQLGRPCHNERIVPIVGG